MAASWVKIYLPQNYFAIRSVCENRWQIKLTGFSAESIVMPDPNSLPNSLPIPCGIYVANASGSVNSVIDTAGKIVQFEMKILNMLNIPIIPR